MSYNFMDAYIYTVRIQWLVFNLLCYLFLDEVITFITHY